MKNRPTEPGYHWWEDTDGFYHVANFDNDMDYFEQCYSVSCYLTVDEFEHRDNFRCWLGNAVPPRSRNEE